ncbi:type II secretion system protein [Desulfosarcina sp.]|uniref:type II secretion system protein n=1 Tax=Desulfosarcina sp. TaxID=2027861 RepID=UPI0029BE7894|nr:type II secretion system protein [Desulfosarcina sp.]MDX2453415.1 type II secretion system protein [Desulfosarcina sp.]MDX2491132.1 type II secretion system protein [Desulfosarcina sp.]
MKNRQAGFTIIEMAMVMVIIGLIVGFGASLIGPLSIRAKRIESTETVDAGAEAVVGHAAANRGVLPTAAQFPGVIKKRNDAWSRPVQYIYDSVLADGNPTTGDMCTRRTTRITLRQCPDAACSAPVSVANVAFLVLSGGENFNNQTAGSLAVNAATVIDVYPNGVGDVDGYAADLNRVEPFDDILQWATLDELRGKIGCRGPQLAIMNNELPPGRTTSPYSAAVYVDGGVPFAAGGDYLWCVETPTGAAPSGLNVRNHTDTGNIGFDTDGAVLAESSAVWTRADHLLINGTPTVAGSFLLTVWVRDNSNPGNDAACAGGASLDNCTSRSFVLTVNP